MSLPGSTKEPRRIRTLPLPNGDPISGVGSERSLGLRVRVQEQTEDARVEIDQDGEIALCLRRGVVTPRAFCALVLALAPVLEKGRQYLQSAS